MYCLQKNNDLEITILVEVVIFGLWNLLIDEAGGGLGRQEIGFRVGVEPGAQGLRRLLRGQVYQWVLSGMNLFFLNKFQNLQLFLIVHFF